MELRAAPVCWMVACINPPIGWDLSLVGRQALVFGLHRWRLCQRDQAVRVYKGISRNIGRMETPPQVLAKAQPYLMQIPKRQYIRSRKLMKAYSLIGCTVDFCGLGPTCGAHSNWSIHGKGRGIKADDNRCASMCNAHHTELDQGRHWSEADKQAIWWAAHVRTVQTLTQMGAWPANVPVPDLTWPKEWA